MTTLQLKSKTVLYNSIILILTCLIFSGCNKEKEPGDNGNNSKNNCSGEAGVLCDVAGIAGERGGSGNGNSALDAFLYWPMDVTQNKDGHIIIVDFNNHCVRKIDDQGVITSIIGSGILGDNPTGPAESINLNHPTGLTVGPNGDYWLAAWHNWKIKKIDKTTWTTTSPIGTSQGLLGDGGPADQAKLDLPSSVVFDDKGNIYVTDQANQRIRKVDNNMIITTFAGGTEGFSDGTGTDAQFSLPKGSNAGPGGRIAISNDKSFLVMADTKNNRIRKIDLTTAEVTTIAGTGQAGYSGDGNDALNAELYWPADVAIAPDDAIYVADTKNHVIRKIDKNGVITTVAGTGEAGYSANGTLAKEAKLNQPSGVYVDSEGTLYIADTYNHQIKKVKNP